MERFATVRIQYDHHLLPCLCRSSVIIFRKLRWRPRRRTHARERRHFLLSANQDGDQGGERMRGNVSTFYFPQTKMATKAANACAGTSALFIFSKLRWRPRRRTQYFRAFNFHFSLLSENSPFVHVWQISKVFI